MPLTLSLKPDFEEAAARYESWWLCQNRGRPIVSVGVRSDREPVLPPAPSSLVERWMNSEYTLALADARISCRPWVAETFPVHHPNVGPDLTATLFGCDLEFGENTSWSHRRYDSPEAWTDFLETEPDFDNPFWQTIEQRMRLCLEQGRGRYLTGLPDLHGAYDILAAVRGPEGVCLDLVDAPDEVHRAGLHAADAYDRAFRRVYGILEQAGQGSTTWCPLWHAGPAYVSSCDFLALVSGEMAANHILPTIHKEIAFTERSLFHLDGPDALRHLDLILSIDRIQAIQWVYGAGAGPVTRWTETYRHILASGHAAQVICETARDAIEMAGHLGSAGVWLTIGEEMASEKEADDLIGEITRAARRNKT
ncbi:MAG: hypothetical protein R3F07_05360 [Opitutaceae bacterium]